MKIDHDIPMPKHGNTKYPWRNMAVGDSFFVPGKTASMMSSTIQTAKLNGVILSTRSVTEDGVKGARVWRVA